MTVVLYTLMIIFILLLLWILMLSPRKNGPSIKDMQPFDYAHRGLFNENDGIDENSMEAFRKATEKGFGSELDLHLTKDGKVVVMHDESLKRTAGVDINISDCTLEEIRKHRLKYTGEIIPTFEDVLSLVAGRVPLIIELKTVKGNYAELTKATLEVLKEYKGKYAIESFDPRVVYWLKNNRPDIIRGQLAENFSLQKGTVNPVLGFFLKNLLTSFLTKPDFISYRVEDRNSLSLRASKAIYGVNLAYWTVRDRELVRKLKKNGALIIFEYPNQRIKKK
ncbi:glycerophosphodiester phosphodiesterase [Alloiococcus sp. CFN-8]|uniref:glycerophosphodiester phosphodiesterase n=1 Tax=Alloiococcus sp. CFN-8 TaxID=3416081 RepID=UPI003CF53A88